MGDKPTRNVLYTIEMDVSISTYFYDRFKEYIAENPDDKEPLIFGSYLGQVVLGSLKSLFEGKVPQIYNPKEGS